VSATGDPLDSFDTFGKGRGGIRVRFVFQAFAKRNT